MQQCKFCGCYWVDKRKYCPRCKEHLLEPYVSPKEIKERCAEVRAGWSEEERIARKIGWEIK